MNAEWTVIGVGNKRTWTLVAPGNKWLARIYAGTQYCTYLVQDYGGEVLLDNTSKGLAAHKVVVEKALRERFQLLASVFTGEAT